MGWCSNMVHDGVHQSLQLLDPVLSKILMLIMQFALPIINAVSMQDLLDLVADFNLGLIADELSRSSQVQIWSSRVLMNSQYSLDGINIGHQGLHTKQKPGQW